jgi:3-deoxy-7-phosphoheptulonate synthase
MPRTENVHIRSLVPLISPAELKLMVPISERATSHVFEARRAIAGVLAGEDPRLLVIVGPCSIHDVEAGLEYAERLAGLAERTSDRIVLVMRTYFEKPRTITGWKGLINDPHLDGTFDMATGLERARRFLLELADRGLPAATEMLDPITPQYIADLISWASIGARTTESQTHRQMASGLSMPIGYKNGTDGELQTAINAMAAAASPHSFLGIDLSGRTCVVNTSGNPWGSVIMRGGRSGPNYEPGSLRVAMERLEEAGLSPRLIVDCSHANSSKDHTLQPAVFRKVLAERLAGEARLVGLMLESNLKAGRQDLGEAPADLVRGVSITDACIGWDETEALIEEAYAALAGDA